MLPRPRPPKIQTDRSRPKRTVRRWGAADWVTVVVVVCYGAAVLVVAAGLFVRLISHP